MSMKSRSNTLFRVLRRFTLLFLFLLLPSLSSGFILLINQNLATEGLVLFDAGITPPNNGTSSYIYRISHHKTPSWAHRLVHLNKTTGQLTLRRNFNDCSSLEPIGGKFYLYVDIISNLWWDEGQNHQSNPPDPSRLNHQNSGTAYAYDFDYISFPLLIVIQPSSSCSKQKLVDEREVLHLGRSIDDLYVSLPVKDEFCHLKSESIGNMNGFLAKSIQRECDIIPETHEDSFYFAIQTDTLDIVLKENFCLFSSFHTSKFTLSLKCSKASDSSQVGVLEWNQLVHLIIHRLGGLSFNSPNNPDQNNNNELVSSRHFDYHPIHRIRRELKNQAPYFENTLYKASVPEEQSAGITVTKIVAVDPEGQTLSYYMTSLLDSRSQQLFSLDSKSGIITSSERLDREKMDVHYFRIVASDSGIPPRTGTATLEINVQDANDHEPIFEQSSYSVSIREGISVGSTVISIRATDQDTGKNSEIFYSILNSHETDDSFRIDSSSGVISTKLPLDREKRDEYTLLIQAHDLSSSQLDRKSSTTTVRIEIKDDNDNYPIFGSKAYSVSVPENIDVSNYPVIAHISATDADEGVNSALRYSIIGGNNQNHFSIDGLSGEVSLIKTFDYESTRSFRLNIRAIDSGNPSRSNSTQLVVSVQDLNDNAPKFFQTIFQETVQENIGIGSSVIRVQAFDADDGLNSKLNYRISSREPLEKFPFEIEGESGWIRTTKELDRENQNRYDFQVIATDFGEVPLSSTASVVIMVQDLNDNDPTFSPKIYETTISENEPPGTPVLTLKATDPDENSRLTYEFTEGNYRNRFSLSTQNGEGHLAIAQPLDFKSERKFVLSIKAIDSGGRFDIATVYIEVLDSNSHAPTFQGTPYSVKIFEDIPVGTVVLSVQATDQDSGQNAQIVYTFGDDLNNEGYEDFMIDSSTGGISTSKLLDREKVSGYILTVVAKDQGIPPMSDTTDVEIVLNDVNDLAPEFEKDYYQAKVSEDVPIGTSILQVQAVDGDQGKNAMVRYSFSTFSDGDGTFSVDSASGIIRTTKSLDREIVSRYDLMVLATDQGSPELSGKTNVKIEIEDVNDNPPMWESDRIRFFIQENSPLGSTVGTLQAYDPDEGSNAVVQYSIVGGTDAESFTLVTHGVPGGGGGGSAHILTKIESLDFESKRKKFDIVVRASSPPLRNDVTVEIHVQDVNDNGPILKPFEIILNNYKDHFPVGPIGRVPAFDADVTDKLHYTILSGNRANLIYLNESTGLITLSPYLDTNVPLTAKIEILVSDGLNEARAEMILNTRMITDEMLFNSVTVQLADMTTEAFLSPLYAQFISALSVTLNSPRENIIVFSVQEELEGSHGVLNVSFAAKKPSGPSGTEDYFSPDYIRERVFLNRLTLSKLSTVEILPFTDDLCLLEPCPNFEDCLSVLRFRNTTNFFPTEFMLFRSVLPWPTFACRCPQGFTGLREHYLCDAEINLCFSSPCRNGGTCFRRERGFSCSCPPDFTGPQCEIHMTMDTCQPNICSKGSTCLPRVRGGFLCQNCTSRGDFVNSLCELTARSFSRGAYLTFPGLKNRYRLHIQLSFATQQRNGLLVYNGRYSEKYDFIALELVNTTIRFSYSLGSSNETTVVETGKAVSDGQWHKVTLDYFNKTATLSIDDCDVILSLGHPDEFPSHKACAGTKKTVLESRCDLFIEACQRFLDLTGPLYIGGLPAPSSTFQMETHDFIGCIKDVFIDYKMLDLNNYVVEHGTVAGCPEKKSFCASGPCKNGGKCIDGWATYKCSCPDGYGQKDCSDDAKPVWNLRDESSFLLFTPQLRPIQFPWYNSVSIRTLQSSGMLMTITLSNNDTIILSLDKNGIVHYTLDGNRMPITLPRLNDGHWHNLEVKWMSAEIWFSLDFGQYEITIPYEATLQTHYVSQVVLGSGIQNTCLQDARVGSARTYLRKPDSEKNIYQGCSLGTACVGALCPPRSMCVEEGGKHKCQCDSGYIGTNCLPICELKPCKNNGSCLLGLSTKRGYTCSCDERYYRGANCEEVLDLSCPSTWWNWPDCAPCSCPAEKNFSPECHKTSGQCKCKEYHYERDGSCADCGCYSVGSISRNCDLYSGKCQCRGGVSGIRCNQCSNPFAEVTLGGCEVISDGCPRSFEKEIWWPRSKFGSTSVHDCPTGSIGLATRECIGPKGWEEADVFNCTSTPLISILNVVGQLEAGEVKLSPLLSTKLAGDLHKALNSSTMGGKLYGNDIWTSLRLLRHLILYETNQKGLYLSHRQDKNFIKNLALSTNKITSKLYAKEWQRIEATYPHGPITLLQIMEDYLAHLTLNQEDTFTRPFEIITRNMVLGLDTVELTWENKDKKNFEDLEIESNYDLYEVSTIKKRAVRFPKYDNIVMDSRRYSHTLKVIVPLDVLGLNEEKEMAGNAVVGYVEYNSLWDILPKRFKSDVDRRFNSELFAYPPIVSLSILASRQGLRKGKQDSPIRLSYEIFGRYIDSSNPQCVVWEEPQENDPTSGGWTTRTCSTQAQESYASHKLGNVMTVNCTCWHLSTFAVLLENNEVQDIPRPSLLEDILSYISFLVALLLIFFALISLGLLKGPVPTTITNTIHKHLLLCIFCSLLLYLIGLKLRLILVQGEIIFCRILAIGLHFFWLSTFSWLLGSALHLRRMFVEVRDVNHGSALSYYALGYFFPMLCVALSLGVRAHYYGNKFFCWLSLYEGIVWGMVGPILLCVLGTLIVFLVAVRAAFTLKDTVIDSGSMRTLLWMDLTLLPISGMVWTLCLLGANERSPIWQYSICAGVLLLSLYISLGYCVFNQRVKDSLYLRAGNLFRGGRDESGTQQSNLSRSALAYRAESGLRAEDLRREMFRGVRSMGISTASTTSRSTTKTSSSPYRSDLVFHTFGGSKYPDIPDSPNRKSYPKRHKPSLEDEEGSSDGGNTLELASSHSSDEDEAIGPSAAMGNGHARNATIAVNGYGTYRLLPPGLITPAPTRRIVSASLSTLHVPNSTNKLPALPRLYSTNWTPNITTSYIRSGGGRSSGNSGSDTENLQTPSAMPQQDPGTGFHLSYPKDYNSTDNLEYSQHQLPELKYNDKPMYSTFYPSERVNDLSGTPTYPPPPAIGIGHGHTSTPTIHHLSLGLSPRGIEPPISPVQELTDEQITPEHEADSRLNSQSRDGIDNRGLNPDEEDEEGIYGGSVTSGVLV